MNSILPFLPDDASTMAGQVDALYIFLIILTAVFSILIAVALAYFVVKYRRRTQHTIPSPIEGSIKLETIWTVIPFMISMGIFAWGSNIYFKQNRLPKEAIDIYVVGKQWMWKFQHPEGQREINELHIPIGRKIRLTMATEDVIHSFYVPAFRNKMDVVPGPNRYTHMWFEATKQGRFHLFCAEYCGTKHSGMIGWVVVMDPKDYQDWLSGGSAQGSMASRGEKLMQDFGCVTCHRSDAQGRGPMLEGLYGKVQTMSTGERVLADESYLRQSILNSQAKIVAGFQPIMPTFQGQVSEEQLQQMIAYIKSIGSPSTAQSVAGSKDSTSGIQASTANDSTTRQSKVAAEPAKPARKAKTVTRAKRPVRKQVATAARPVKKKVAATPKKQAAKTATKRRTLR